MELAAKRNEYTQYIKEHIANVQKAYQVFGEELFDLLQFNKKKFELLLSRHDESKFSVDEFEPYRQKFFPIEGEVVDEKKFNDAWKHHYMNNPHHPEYWFYCDKKPKDMPDSYIAEMFCDWAAMSMKFHSHPLEWWNKNWEDKKAVMTEDTFEQVSRIMHQLNWDKYDFFAKDE